MFNLSSPRFKNLKTHIICWGLFILYESLVSYSYTGTIPGYFDYVGHYSLNISLFYLNAYLIECYIVKDGRKIFKFALIILLELAAYVAIKYLMYLAFIFFQIYKLNQISSLFMTESLYRAIYFIGLSTGYWFARSNIKQQKLIAELERDRLKVIIEKELAERSMLESENTYLKAQINPHFLFNILGFIHNSLLKYSKDAADMVILLSDMMRYALRKPEPGNKVDLIDEIEHINNYIAINQYRYHHRLFLEFRYHGEIGQVQIIPLLLITIVENMFKYGDLFDENDPASILLETDGKELNLDIINTKRKQENIKGFGIGMSNVIKRLEYNYKGRFKLHVDDAEKKYVLKLSITVND